MKPPTTSIGILTRGNTDAARTVALALRTRIRRLPKYWSPSRHLVHHWGNKEAP